MSLIKDNDGRAYHLGLYPEDVAPNILLVGDPDRVPLVSKHFDNFTVERQKREFRTHIGKLNNTNIMVISTGMGGPCIEIVMNELDALVNENGKSLKRLTFIRLGTSGAVKPDIEVGEVLASAFAFGLDGIVNYYPQFRNDFHPDLSDMHLFEPLQTMSYMVHADKKLLQSFSKYRRALTCTLPGFYAPQGRRLRLLSLKMLEEFERLNIDNLEMETSTIYAMSKLLGHSALSLNLILANRINNTFAPNPSALMDNFLDEFFVTLRKII